MIVCPVCGYPQPHGVECDLCGKRLAPGPSEADLAIPPLEGLEPTRVESLGAPDAPESPIPDLEPTLGREVGDVPYDPTPGLEETRAAPIDVDAPLIPDLERTAPALPDDPATPLPEVVVCRYCRTPAAPGDRMCARCGVRLPVPIQAASERAGESARLCTCGTAVRPGASLCPSCGARLAS